MRRSMNMAVIAALASVVGMAAVAETPAERAALNPSPKPQRDDAARIAAAKLKRERKARKRAKYLRQP